MGSESLHEPPESLRPETIDTHRAVRSLFEELDAVDWYSEQRESLGIGRPRDKDHL